MITENLKQNDLRQLVDPIVEIDSYASKMGNDADVITLTFSVKYKSAANDLVAFVESGYPFVMDADSSKGELSDGKYRVFIELKRDHNAPENITEVLYGVGKLSNIKDFKFRYYKSFTSHQATKEKLESIPTNSKDYKARIDDNLLENYEYFFKSSMLEAINMTADTIEFKRIYKTPLKMRFVESGKRDTILEGITDRISLYTHDISEVIFLTKYIGNYNITKYGKNTFVMENKDHAIIAELL